MADFTALLSRFRAATEQPDAYAVLLRTLTSEFATSERAEISRCDREAERLHSKQLRADGSPYIVHPRRVAALVASYLVAGRSTAVLTALCHDLIEDCGVTDEWLTRQYGADVARGVQMLSAPSVAGESMVNRRERKIAKWQSLTSASYWIRSVHAMDVLDNTISWRFITEEMPAWCKIPRWMWQVVHYQIPLLSGSFNDVTRELEAEVEYQRDRGFDIGSWDSP